MGKTSRFGQPPQDFDGETVASAPGRPSRKFVNQNDLKTVINQVGPVVGGHDMRHTMQSAAVVPRPGSSNAPVMSHPPQAGAPPHLSGTQASTGYAYTTNRAPQMSPGATMAMEVANPLLGGGVPSQIARAHEPPEISLTRHQMPEDISLDERLVLSNEPDSDRAASFRVLRHHLLESGRPQVIVVSSPGPGEGKTTTAVNLALALAECGRARVLLCEANVARPQLATVFRFVPPWCFAEQLTAHREQPLLPWGLVEIPELWLHVAAINPRITQNQLLDAPAFEIAMERLRMADYDHIVIDAPPVLGSADVNLIQDASDGVLLTLFGRKMTARALRLAVEQLTPTRILGTVLLEG